MIDAEVKNVNKNNPLYKLIRRFTIRHEICQNTTRRSTVYRKDRLTLNKRNWWQVQAAR
jgi:hypothetical protein